MWKREHDRILSITVAAADEIISALREEIGFLREQNTDLLNRAMSQDWASYTALSAVPQEAIEIPDRLYDGTGLIDILADE